MGEELSRCPSFPSNTITVEDVGKVFGLWSGKAVCVLFLFLLVSSTVMPAAKATLVVGPVSPSSITVPVQTTSVTGASMVSSISITPSSVTMEGVAMLSTIVVLPSTTNVVGVSTVYSTTIQPSTVEVTGVATLLTITITPSFANVAAVITDPITPSTEEVVPSIQTSSPTSVRIEPSAGTHTAEASIQTISPLATTTILIVGASSASPSKTYLSPSMGAVTPVVGTAKVNGIMRIPSPESSIAVPIVGNITTKPWTTTAPPTPPPPEDKPPTCVVKLQKGGVEINEVDVGEFFDIYVGGSKDDFGIKEVRFSSDDTQDGIPTGEWTGWYGWSISSGDWNAETKIKRWTFATYGEKEVWVEVKDTGDNTDRSHANIFAGWTFAIITDLHIGRGYGDYGGKGVYLPEDSQVEGRNYYLTDRLNETVNFIIENQGKYNIKFVVVLGDISDSGEYSELKKAKDILDRLNGANIPYVPVIGNHDVWPYTQDEEDQDLRYFKYVFRDQFNKLAQDSKFNLKLQPGEFVNYNFSYKGLNFIALDFNSRTHASLGLGHGTEPGAVLHEETLVWLSDCLDYYEGKPIVLLSHHPMVDPEARFLPIWQYVSMEFSCFDDNQLRTLAGIFRDKKANIKANFAGHVHGFYDEQKSFIPNICNPVFLDANINYRELGFTPENIDVITTEALMVGSNEPIPKGIVRIIKVENEKIDFNTIDGEFRALNPYFKAKPPVFKEKYEVVDYWLNYLNKGEVHVDFEAYAFTKRFSKEHPLAYSLNYGDGSAEIKYSDEEELITFTHYYNIKAEKTYNVTLTVLGYTPGGESIIEKITRKIILPSPLTVIAESPIDLIVTDPDGLRISKQLNEIPGSIYAECDINQDGHVDDLIYIPDRKMGDYLVVAAPESDAKPTDTFTLEVWAENMTTIFAENVQIKNIPTQPYIVRSTQTNVIPIIPATVDFDPNSFNLKSKGQWVTVYIELPVGHGYNVSMINLTTVMLNGQVYAEATPFAIGDYDSDGIPDLMVKFNRAAVQAILQVGDQVEITINGKLTDGRLFEGKDTIQVILPP